MQDMGYDAEVLQRVINDHDLSVKQLARAANKHINVVYAYLTGRRNIPIDIWHALFQATRDKRILELLVAGVPIEMSVIDEVPDLADDIDLIREAVRNIGEFHNLQKYLVEIIADGRIDQSDAASVRKFNDQYVRYRDHSIALHRAINRAFRKSIPAKRVSRT